MSNLHKHLRLASGPFGILASASDILEITAYQPALCAGSGSAASHHGKTVAWRAIELPFLCLRTCLQQPAAEPSNTLVLQDAAGEPLAMLAIDTVCGILTVDEDLLFHFEGIHAELNNLFDRLYADNDTGDLLLHLKPAAAWIPAALQRTGSCTS